MTDKTTQAHAGKSNMQKDPEDCTTGDEPKPGAQRSHLKALSKDAKEPFEDKPFEDSLTKAEASRRIDELQNVTGRGVGAGGMSPA